MTVKSKSFTSSQEIGYPRVLTLTSQVSSEFSVISATQTGDLRDICYWGIVSKFQIDS